MISRLHDNIVTHISEAEMTALNLKSTQPIGADATEIRVLNGLQPWDADFNPLPNGARGYVNITFTPDALKEWQESTYNEVRYGIFIGNVGDPILYRYDGTLLNVLPSAPVDAETGQASIQMVNVSGVDKRVIIQAYALTTAMAGELSTNWFTA